MARSGAHEIQAARGPIANGYDASPLRVACRQLAIEPRPEPAEDARDQIVAD